VFSGAHIRGVFAPMFLYWLLIQPFVNSWRGKGIGMTYGVASET
jgi:hypothetical protein